MINLHLISRQQKAAAWMGLFLLLLLPVSAHALVYDYPAVLQKIQDENGVVVSERVPDGMGGLVEELPVNETVYVSHKSLYLYPAPSEWSPVAEVKFGAMLSQIGVCKNGFSHVRYTGKSHIYEGYVLTRGLTDALILDKMQEMVTVREDSEILDYPSTRDGMQVGTIKASDAVMRTAGLGDTWSRVSFIENGRQVDGYVLTSSLLLDQEETVSGNQEAGTLHESEGSGVFAEAVEGVTQAQITTTGNVLVGTPEAVPETVTLTPLGVFRITHYCPCSICCGPYADGITSTGVTAVTNHTIAVSPSQIPYGSRVAINGQIYYAEDCGSAIVQNCIDVYVATHEEAWEKGVFYTEVYLVT